jgi:flavodoxin
MSREGNEAHMGNWKVLTVFYSHSGNTRECANQINKEVGGDIVELIPAEPYPTEYGAVVDQAKKELKLGYKPALKTRIENIESYDVIFVGSPNWWNTVAPPVATFLGTYDLSGKASVPFITHAGSGLGRSAQDIASLCPDSTVLEGLAVWGKEVKTAHLRVAAWLRKLGM